MKFFIALSIILIFQACDIFETRNPDSPDSDNTFLPPTSYDLVIENLKNSLLEKNPVNYISCLSDRSISNLNNFVFIADPSINSQNPALFDGWSISEERIFVNTLFSNLIQESTPIINFQNDNFQILSDSIVYLCDYNLVYEFSNQIENEIVTGNFRIVLKNNDNGFWYITSWFDFGNENPSDNEQNYSQLKIRFL